MTSDEHLARFKTLEEATLHFAQHFAECSHKGEHEGAKAALREILRLYPPAGPALETFQLRQGRPVIVSGMFIGQIYTQKGTTLDLSNVFRSPAFVAPSGDRFDQVYLRTVSGNIYRIAHSSSEGTFHLADAKARRKFAFAPSFPAKYSVTLGAPFSGDVIQTGGPMLRRTSPVSEVVLVCSSRRYDLDTLHSFAQEESSVVDEYDNVLGSKGITLGVEPSGMVILSGTNQIGHTIRRASLRELFESNDPAEGIGVITHVFLRTGSGNIYRIEKDVPIRGQATIVDMRVSLRNSNTAARVYTLAELTTVIVEEGAPFRLGAAVTSPLREIIAYNSAGRFKTEDLDTMSKSAVSTIVDDFKREMGELLRRG